MLKCGCAGPMADLNSAFGAACPHRRVLTVQKRAFRQQTGRGLARLGLVFIGLKSLVSLISTVRGISHLHGSHVEWTQPGRVEPSFGQHR